MSFIRAHCLFVSHIFSGTAFVRVSMCSSTQNHHFNSITASGHRHQIYSYIYDESTCTECPIKLYMINPHTSWTILLDLFFTSHPTAHISPQHGRYMHALKHTHTYTVSKLPHCFPAVYAGHPHIYHLFKYSELFSIEIISFRTTTVVSPSDYMYIASNVYFSVPRTCLPSSLPALMTPRSCCTNSSQTHGPHIDS